MIIRLRIFGFLFAAAIIGLIARLFFWQIIEASSLSKQGRLQYQRSSSVIAKRGSIYATDGSFLTTDIDTWTVFATSALPKENIRIVANKLSPLLKLDPSKIEGILDNRGSWTSIEHRVTNDIKKNIEALDIPGIGFDPEPTRTYPEGSSSAHILGFVGKNDAGDDTGYFGLEGFYNATLAGKEGLVSRESDAKGTPILFGNGNVVNATEGVDLTTNIDKTVQLSIEKELNNGITQYGAKKGSVIIMDPNSGAILGMASFTSYDPGSYWTFSNDDFKDSTISDTFEPGSIFKPITMAAALDAGVVKPDTQCDICDAPVTVNNYTIETWNNQYHPNSTITSVILNSANVGMVFTGRKLGHDKFYDYLDKFGIGKATGIDLQGEVNIPLRKKGTWSDIDVATTTFGQGIAVTPIQILRAIGIIANGGRSIKPEVVKQIK